MIYPVVPFSVTLSDP